MEKLLRKHRPIGFIASASQHTILQSNYI